MFGTIVTGVIGQAILVISGVVMARALGPEHRGVLALLFVLSTIAVQAGSLGAPVSVTYWIATRKSSPRALMRSLRGFRQLQLIVVLGVNAGLILIVLEPRSTSNFLWVAFLSLAATAAALSQMYGLAVLQGLGRFATFNVLRTLQPALCLLGVVTLWTVDQAALKSITLTLVGATVVSASATSIVLLKQGNIGRTAGDVSRSAIVAFGARSLLGSSPPVETFRLDQLLVGLVLSPIALGYYVVAMAFTNLGRFVGQSIGMVTYPQVAGAPDPSSHLRILRRNFALGAVICGGLTIPLFVMMPTLLPFFFGTEFRLAAAPAQILLIGAFFGALRRILVDGTRGSGQPLWGAVAESTTLLALPFIVFVSRSTDSLEIVSLVVAAANFVGLLVVAPALLRRGSHLEPADPDGSNLSDGLLLSVGHPVSAKGSLSPKRKISLD